MYCFWRVVRLGISSRGAAAKESPTDRMANWQFPFVQRSAHLAKDFPEFKPSYNIAPGQYIPVIVREKR